MAISKHKGINITAIVNVLPKQVVDNLHLTLIPNNADRKKLIEHTGIRYRRVTEKPVKSLFESGIKQLLDLLKLQTSDVDVLICVTQTPDVGIPSIACKIHGDLNFGTQTLCYDINAGCSGYVYGLQTVASILATIDKVNPKAILCCGDVSSQLLFANDTSTQPIFSDAVSVTAITFDKNDKENYSYFNLETFGAGQQAIYTETSENNEKKMRLNGIDVFAYSVKHVPQNITTLLDAANLNSEEASCYILHQANKLINDAICKKTSVPLQKAPQTLGKYGNTASASIPITLCENLDLITAKNNSVLLCGFGVGFSVASALIDIPINLPHKLIEV